MGAPCNNTRSTFVRYTGRKTACLQEMLEMSRILAAGLHQVRVDWYYVEGQLYFGEITFFDASGFDDFEPDEWNELVGSWIKISV